jgi:DNA-binding response OmpR family regulator
VNVKEAAGLITDIRLGDGPNGGALARDARASRPDLPIHYVSGDGAHEWRNQGVAGSKMLQKPFGPTRMLAEVRELFT